MQGLARRAEQTVMRAVLAIAREKFAADLHMDSSIFDQPAWDVGQHHFDSLRGGNDIAVLGH